MIEHIVHSIEKRDKEWVRVQTHCCSSIDAQEVMSELRTRRDIQSESIRYARRNS